MTNVDKRVKLQELRSSIEYLNTCINKAEISDDNADEIVAMAEIILTKAYNLYPDITRVFK